MRSLSLNCFIAACLLAEIAAAHGQVSDPDVLATLVRSDIRQLDAEPNLTSWRGAHFRETVEVPHDYDVEYASQGLWCARSTAHMEISAGLEATRAALFYVPRAAMRQVDLPEVTDRSRVGKCELLGFWYEVHKLPSLDQFAISVSKQLSQAWGEPAEISKNDRHLWGSGRWDSVSAWSRGNKTIWVAADPKGRLDGDARLIIIAHNSHVSFTYSTDSWRGDPPAGQPLLAEAAANLSGLGSNLAAPLLKRLHTQAVPSAEQPSPISVPPLVRWVNAAHSLPVQRKAAALVLADLYLSLGQQLGGFGTDLPATPVG